MTDPIGFTLEDLHIWIVSSAPDVTLSAMLTQLRDLLSVEPPTPDPTGDLVSRAAVREMLRGSPDGMWANSIAVGEAFAALPSAQVSREPVEAPVECTGLAATWCPKHGDCACPVKENGERDLNHRTCPLHGELSDHSERAEDAEVAELKAELLQESVTWQNMLQAATFRAVQAEARAAELSTLLEAQTRSNAEAVERAEKLREEKEALERQAAELKESRRLDRVRCHDLEVERDRLAARVRESAAADVCVTCGGSSEVDISHYGQSNCPDCSGGSQ